MPSRYTFINAETKWPPFSDCPLTCIFWMKTLWILIKISVNFGPNRPIDDNPVLVQIITWVEQATRHYLHQCWPWILTHICVAQPQWINTLRPRQNGRHFPDDIFKGIFLNENEWISLKISLKFALKVRINNIPAFASDNGLAPTRQQAIIWTNDG